MAEPLVCAIHQPNFFPWLGFFDKIRLADVFVLLDAVDYPKSGSSMGSWCNRVRINVHGCATWIRAPVLRQSGRQLVKDTFIEADPRWCDKLLRTLEINYKRAPNFAAAMALIEPLLRFPETRLSLYNEHAIVSLADRLGLDCRFVRQSDLDVSGQGTELLVGITRAVGAQVYLCGNGSGGYQDDACFARAGLDLRYQAFEPRPYGEADRWLPGLSVIDLVMQRPAELGLP